MAHPHLLTLVLVHSLFGSVLVNDAGHLTSDHMFSSNAHIGISPCIVMQCSEMARPRKPYMGSVYISAHVRPAGRPTTGRTMLAEAGQVGNQCGTQESLPSQ